MSHVLRAFKADDQDSVKELILSILMKEYPFDKSPELSSYDAYGPQLIGFTDISPVLSDEAQEIFIGSFQLWLLQGSTCLSLTVPA